MINYKLKHGENYSYVENILSKNQIEYLIQYWNKLELGNILIDSNEWDIWSPKKTSMSHHKRKVEICGIPKNHIPFLTNKIKDIFKLIIDYNFGIEGPHYFTSYSQGSFHSKHKDFGTYNGVNRQKVITIQLSDNYEGGDLIINGEIAPKSLGTAILYNGDDIHEVTEITKGHRFSITECAGQIK